MDGSTGPAMSIKADIAIAYNVFQTSQLRFQQQLMTQETNQNLLALSESTDKKLI